ncbi:protein-methionine-sulfoxide reductase catalytic subunit MsrP [Kordiimonas gwangyangensis]|uniref:protein-methionine-sulfoxide reductase catalytic subunit MsrP n=1 Tax=Kordiimonas gwangyangensis TaxID=288022 RepID=UPI00036D0D4F|nr:protein-methionine-sulfoxide reductase catalytic subunit MsrP [Kordiimonas gwangyangensis]
MMIKSRKPWQISENEVTPEQLYLNRRAFIGGSAGAALLGVTGLSLPAGAATERVLNPLAFSKTAYDPKEALTPYEAVTAYNNYYEFGTGKSDPAENAWRLQPKPWSVKVDGHVGRPGIYDFEDLIDMKALEERIYRLRCVEAWSMVIPWIGVPLSLLIKKFEPTADAKYVAFETLADKKQMPEVKGWFNVLDWPYREGLRMDEAMNELAFIAVGLYGKELPNQNGAPLRLVVPWKYGFKSIKSIVRISFVEDQPKTSWKKSAPSEYGFYSNVNPNVDHPRWSQKQERRIGEFGRRETLMFNGYEDAVAHLYQGMDLRKNY